MSVRLINWRGTFMFTVLDSFDEPLPIECHRRAWRQYTYPRKWR